MEGALTWLFGTVHHRVPDGRTSSFTQPVLPLPTGRPSSSVAAPHPPPGVRACPLPSPRPPNARPRPATVGYRADDWADHYATYLTNSRGQRIFVQVWRPLSHVKNDAACDFLMHCDDDDDDDGESASSSSSSPASMAKRLVQWVKQRRHSTTNNNSDSQPWTVGTATAGVPVVSPVVLQNWSSSSSSSSSHSQSSLTPPRRLKMRRNKEKAIVYIIHGLNDHSNKYARVARSWVDAGYVVVAHDFHGHGRSDGFRAYTSSMDHYVRDAFDAIRHADQQLLPSRLNKLPKFLLAHSLGGAVAIHLARDYHQQRHDGGYNNNTVNDDNKMGLKFNGVMLTAPAVRVFPKPLLKLFAPVLATLAPLLPVQRLKFDRRQRKRRGSGSGSSNRKSSDEDDDEYCPYEDPLVVRSPVRARVGYEVLKSCERIMSEADRFKVPVFVAHSAHDRVTNARGTVEFHSRIASDDKTVKLYDGSVHDLLAEKREVVMADMVDWASKRLR